MPTYTGTPVTADSYCSTADVKTELNITDSDDDTRIDRIVVSVSRQIDDWLGRPSATSSGTRYYTAMTPWRIDVDPFTSLTSVAYDSVGDWSAYTTYASTEYQAGPWNAAALSRPYDHIVLVPNVSRTLPLGLRGVRVVATWGYAVTTPPVIREAALMQSALVYRQQVAGGAPIAGGADFAQPLIQAGLHPMVRRMLEPYRTGVGMGIA